MCSHCGKIGYIMEMCYKLVGFTLGYKQKSKPAMANQITTTEIDSYKSEGSTSFLPNNNINGFPFTPEQCQQLMSLLNSTASTFGTKKVLSHMANSALLGISCDYFQYGTCLDLNILCSMLILLIEMHMVVKLGCLTLELQIILSILSLYLPRLLAPPLLLFNYLMEKRPPLLI